MKLQRYITPALLALVIALPAIGSRALAQLSDPPAAPATGTEYYVSFLQNEDVDHGVTANRFMGLMITSSVPTTGQVEYRDSATGVLNVKPFSVVPGKIVTIPIPRTLEAFEEKAQPAVHVTSRDPVSVFAMNSRLQSGAGFAAIPVSLWGTRYLPMTMPNGPGWRAGEFTIVAAYNNTIITINPSGATQYKEAGADIDVVLQKGETFFVQGRMNRPNEDLSTSEIVSTSRPIGVISGHVQTPITADQAVSSPFWTGHQAAMILTDSLWGKEYFSVPSRSGGDRFRLMPAFDGTTVTITHFPPGGGISTRKVTLDRGDILDTAAINGQAITGPVHWSATGPMIVMQLRTSGAYGDPENSPSSIPLPAANNFSSYSVFAAPDQMGGDAFTSHTLTIIGTGGSSGTPMGGIRLDGKELGAVDASAVAQRIGNTDYYYVVMHIGSGGHILSSDDGTVFAGTLRGSNGTLARDAYAWTLPYWSPRVAADARPPYVIAPSVSGNKLTATISDSAAAYFSGVAGVTVVRNPKWQLDGPFVAPAQSENVSVTFTATGDPSGPLWVALTDRAGNIDTVKISDGICSRPASADRDNIRLSTPVTVGTGDSVLVTANPCGDSARVISVDPGTGNAVPYLHVGFAEATPFTIQGHGAIRLVVRVDPIAQKGSYTTTITITLDGGATIVLPLQIEVTPPAGVDADAATGAMELTVYPNPFASATTITAGGPLGGSATVTISDQLGRTIREIAGERLAGKRSILWDGLDGRGIAAPTGIYFIRVNDGGHQAIRNVTLIR